MESYLSTQMLPSDIGSLDSGQDGRQPRRSNPRTTRVHLRRSRKLVVFWLNQKLDPGFYSPEQVERIAIWQSKVNEVELHSAVVLYKRLLSEPRTLSRFMAQHKNTPVPRTHQARIPEKRRIGVGYRDKGSLRPLHESGRDMSEEAIWDEDIPYLLTSTQITGQWITRSEVIEYCHGLNYYQLSLTAVLAQTVGSPYLTE